MIDDKMKKRYIRAVSRNIHCGKRAKEAALQYALSTINEISVNSDNASVDDIFNALGDPKAAAQSFSTTIDPSEFKKHKNHTVAILIVIGVIIIGMVAGFYAIVLYDHSNIYYIGDTPASIASEETQ